jgi:hypothetical protein
METTEFIGNVQTTFISWQPLHIIRKNSLNDKAYSRLLEEAQSKYGYNVDVKNIKITGSFSLHNLWVNPLAFFGAAFLGFVLGGESGAEEGSIIGGVIGLAVSGNVQKITASGDIISLENTRIEGALEKAAGDVAENFPARSRIAIVYITAQDRSATDYITGEIEHILRQKGFTIIDRAELDRVRAEQQFGASGEVDDSTAARIGHIAGASIIITGRVDGEGNLRRLRLRALDTTSAQVVGTASERF